ncbi:hypothetical protein Q6D67_18480 [Haliea sp. E1-2-M8]|uniref:hypothetical protein n=1 Tax=Haliea sp. E1-2-M8 TaxID=3064706 RepID=UPI0027285A29|nr:hypothetical protein [Haliea sp. E1-2-M8]MDO8863684.1 hypothetical protein [Haliea sp. E1-2-M8]
MRNDCLRGYSCPLFLFDPEACRGQLLNPATGLVVLEFPNQVSWDDTYSLHEASVLSPGFAGYLHYLVNDHILFNHPTCEELACVEEEADLDEDPDEHQDHVAESDLEFSTVWFRSPLQFTGLSGLYDRLGFCFLDGALYAPMYCEVIEILF